MNTYLTYLTAMIGDDSKPFLVAICLIVSVILMAVLIIMGKKNNSDDDTDEDDMED